MFTYVDIVKKLNENEWDVKVDRSLPQAGDLDEDEYTITINPHYGDSVLTLIHEVLHLLLENEACRIHKSLTCQQHQNLIEIIYKK